MILDAVKQEYSEIDSPGGLRSNTTADPRSRSNNDNSRGHNRVGGLPITLSYTDNKKAPRLRKDGGQANCSSNTADEKRTKLTTVIAGRTSKGARKGMGERVGEAEGYEYECKGRAHAEEERTGGEGDEGDALTARVVERVRRTAAEAAARRFIENMSDYDRYRSLHSRRISLRNKANAGAISRVWNWCVWMLGLYRFMCWWHTSEHRAAVTKQLFTLLSEDLLELKRWTEECSSVEEASHSRDGNRKRVTKKSIERLSDDDGQDQIRTLDQLMALYDLYEPSKSAGKGYMITGVFMCYSQTPSLQLYSRLLFLRSCP